VAETLRVALTEQVVEFGGNKLTVSASFGVAGWDQIVPADAAVDAVVARCDECVYESKAGGRNRVTAKSMD
jgi:PleD family two-component response regulator